MAKKSAYVNIRSKFHNMSKNGKALTVAGSVVGVAAITTAVVVPTVLLTNKNVATGDGTNNEIMANDNGILTFGNHEAVGTIGDKSYRLVEQGNQPLLTKAYNDVMSPQTHSNTGDYPWMQGVIAKEVSAVSKNQYDMDLHTIATHNWGPVNAAHGNPPGKWTNTQDAIAWHSMGDTYAGRNDAYILEPDVEITNSSYDKFINEDGTLMVKESLIPFEDSVNDKNPEKGGSFPGVQWQVAPQRVIEMLATSMDYIYEDGNTTYRNQASKMNTAFESYLNEFIKINSGVYNRLTNHNLLVVGKSSQSGITYEQVGKDEVILDPKYGGLLYADKDGSNIDGDLKGHGVDFQFPAMTVDNATADGYYARYNENRNGFGGFLGKGGDPFSTELWTSAYKGNVDTLVYIAAGEMDAGGYQSIYDEDNKFRQKVLADENIMSVLKEGGQVIFVDSSDWYAGYWSMYGQYNMLQLLVEGFNDVNNMLHDTDNTRPFELKLPQYESNNIDKPWNFDFPTVSKVRPSTNGPIDYSKYHSEHKHLIPNPEKFTPNNRGGMKLYSDYSYTTTNLLSLGILPDYVAVTQLT